MLAPTSDLLGLEVKVAILKHPLAQTGCDVVKRTEDPLGIRDLKAVCGLRQVI